MDDSIWDESEGWTQDVTQAGVLGLNFRRFALAGRTSGGATVGYESTADRCAIGAHPKNDLELPDPTVSRFHAEIVLRSRGPFVRDLGSRNGTFVDGVRVEGAYLRHGSELRLGKCQLAFEVLGGTVSVPLSRAERFGSLYGTSVAMRRLFALLERMAPTDATVLLEGETGTGKEEAAQSIHAHSPRAEGPFITLDCGAIPATLLESELFGHERGAFTGAHAAREGVFEAAHGGTLFLDEIGELPLAMQPSLLRVLEQRELRRVGSTETRPVDVRVIAATNRDLREEVSAGRFREDLFYRLAVLHVRVPALRERLDDVPGLARVLLERMGLAPDAIERVFTSELSEAISRGRWAGNVRELRNYLSRYVLLGEVEPIAIHEPEPARVDVSLEYAEARNRALAAFERHYAEGLLAAHGDNVSAAARAAGIARPYLHRLLRRHGLR